MSGISHVKDTIMMCVVQCQQSLRDAFATVRRATGGTNAHLLVHVQLLLVPGKPFAVLIVSIVASCSCGCKCSGDTGQLDALVLRHSSWLLDQLLNTLNWKLTYVSQVWNSVSATASR